jgi:hypothetical protein
LAIQFFNKPLHYSRWINKTISELEDVGEDPNDSYAMIIDTDVILNARPLKDVWKKFDCARKGKPILMGGETGCWFGLQCKQRHVDRYYTPLGPTLNTFINSGYIMGTLPGLQKLFSYIVNNHDYIRRMVYWIHWFCDQSAFTMFYGSHRDIVQIDEYQQVFGTLSIFAPSGRVRDANTCRDPETYSVMRNCSEKLYDLTSFSIDSNSCVLSTSTHKLHKKDIMLLPYLSQMSPDPIAFHGNSMGKRVAQLLRPMLKKCLKKKYNNSAFDGNFTLDK